MTVAGVPGAATIPDAVVAIAITALERQESGLAAAAARLDRCSSAVPASADDTWQGPARTAYEAGLARLRQLLSSAAVSIDDALVETRRAVASVRQDAG